MAERESEPQGFQGHSVPKKQPGKQQSLLFLGISPKSQKAFVCWGFPCRFFLTDFSGCELSRMYCNSKPDLLVKLLKTKLELN